MNVRLTGGKPRYNFTIRLVVKFFMENKNQRVLTIIIVATVLVLVIIFAGVTYAYFTANNPEGSTAHIISENGRMLITYNDGTDNVLPVKDIQPSNAILVNKTFTLTGINTTVGTSSSDGLTMPYKVGVQYTSGFSDGMLHYYIKATSKSTGVTEEYTGETNKTVQGNETYTGYSHGTFKKGNNKYTEMVTGEFSASLNNQTITFNLIIQFPDNNENQDSEKGKTFNGKVVVNYDLPEATTFAEDSWETIAAVVQSGQLDAYAVGSEKKVEIAGTSYTVRVANNTTPDECNQEDFSQTACGFVVEFVDIIIQESMNSTDTNVGGWPATSVRTLMNGGYFNYLPSDLQKVIIETKAISGHGRDDKNLNREDGNWESTDKLYLLSPHEIWEDVSSNSYLKKDDTAYNNTRQLDYYKSKEVTTDNYSSAIKNSTWWLRTAAYNLNSYFIGVTIDGYFGSIDAVDEVGITPAFRIG